MRHGTIPEPAVVSTDDETATHQRENEDVPTGLGSTATTRGPTHPPTASAAIARAAATLAAATMLGAAAVACGGGDAPRQGDARGSRGGALSVETARRALVVAFAAETLSSAARILALHPGSGADSVVIAFTFADSVRGVSAGLGVLDLRADDAGRVAHLAWPDSVRKVWWAASAPHLLVFTTAMGRGVTVQVDVAADTLGVAVDTGGAARTLAVPSRSASIPTKAAIDRAVTFVDSTHQQPAGRAASGSALRYSVDSTIATADGRLAAFHVTASDSTGRRVNPAWYALALPSGNVAPIDSVVGPVSELPASAGAWGGAQGATFYYARRAGVYEVRVRE